MIPEPGLPEGRCVCGTGSGKEGFSGRGDGSNRVLQTQVLREFECHLMGSAMGLGRTEEVKRIKMSYG